LYLPLARGPKYNEHSSSSSNIEQRRKSMYMTVKQLAEKYPFMTEGAIRWQVFHQDRNGFKTCLVKLGRRVLISEQGFLDWVESHRECK
jgi:hypothetical protein